MKLRSHIFDLDRTRSHHQSLQINKKKRFLYQTYRNWQQHIYYSGYKTPSGRYIHGVTRMKNYRQLCLLSPFPFVLQKSKRAFQSIFLMISFCSHNITSWSYITYISRLYKNHSYASKSAVQRRDQMYPLVRPHGKVPWWLTRLVSMLYLPGWY